MNDEGKVELFKSYNDSNWLDETFFASKVYKGHLRISGRLPERNESSMSL